MTYEFLKKLVFAQKDGTLHFLSLGLPYPAAHTSDPGSVGGCHTRCPVVTGRLTSPERYVSILGTNSH